MDQSTFVDSTVLVLLPTSVTSFNARVQTFCKKSTDIFFTTTQEIFTANSYIYRYHVALGSRDGSIGLVDHIGGE